jgi:PAS domain S-box-containing protein
MKKLPIEKRVVLVFIFALIVLFVFGYYSNKSITDLIDTFREAEHTQQTLHKLDEIVRHITAAETSSRGFIITGDDRYLKPFQPAVTHIYTDFKDIKKLIDSESPRQKKIETLESLIAEKIAGLRKRIEIRKNRGFEAAASEVKSGKGRIVMEKITQLAGEIEKEEMELFIMKSSKAKTSAVYTTIIITFGSFIALVFGGIATYYNHLELIKRRRTEESLRFSEEKFSKAFRSSPDWIAITTLDDGRYIDVNDAFLRTTGYKREEVIGNTSIELGIWVDPAERAKMIKTLREKGAIHNYEVKFHTKSGDILTMLRSVEVMEIQGKQRLLSINRDITERKKVEETLFESESKLRAITETACDAIIMMDNEGNISYWNEAAEKIFGHSSQEALGKEMHIFLAPLRYHKAYREGFSRFKITGQGPAIGKLLELVAVKKNGMEFPMELSVSSVQFKGLWHAVGILHDISERKNLEQQLRHAQKMEAIGQLAGGIAHDFNNTLQTIMSIGELMLIKIKKDDPLREYANDLLVVSDRAANFTQSLLAFSRKQTINPMPVNLNEIVKNAEKFLSRIIGEDIELLLELSDKDLTVMVDYRQIEQVLMNLTTNARDAMPKGGKLIIGTGLAEIDEEFIKNYGYGKTGKYALMTVTDTGIGMDSNTQERIFEPFFSTKEIGKGTGLGLPSVYGIIKQHDGYITLSSKIDKGSTFRIYLPLIETKAEEIKLPEEITEIKELTGGTETILVAEDEEHVRKFIKNTLESFGYHIIEASTGDDAIKKFIEHKDKIQLLFLDVIMPGRSGKEAYYEIRKIKPDIKIIFASGFPNDFIKLNETIEGKLNFISKPVPPTTLLRKIREVLDN